jgi:hypothetical protein
MSNYLLTIYGGHMHIPDDYDQFYAELDARTEFPCEICGEACTLHGDNNYCDVCQERIDREEQEAETVRDLPILRPIEQRPVELNAVLWQEWKRLAEKMS